MISHYVFLFATGMLGAVLLLILQIFTRMRGFIKPVAAFWLSLVTLLWAALPPAERWLFSLWAPSTMLGGQLVLDVTPPIWALGLGLGFVFAGTAWAQVADRRRARPLSGALSLLTLLVAWLALASGSLLTTLAAWAIFDLLWGAAGLIYGSASERMTFGWTLHGAASLVLWTVFLLLDREGGSTLWWLMGPSQAVISLLLGAALLRIGVYPLHVSHSRHVGELDVLMLASSLSPILGVSLLYRVQNMPGLETLPPWVVALGLLSLFWGGVQAWLRRKAALRALWAAYGLLGLLVVGVTVPETASLVLRASVVWFGGWALYHLSRYHDAATPSWSWPGWMGLLFVVGLFPSALGSLLLVVFGGVGWGARLLLVMGWGLLGGAALQAFADKLKVGAEGAAAPAWSWQRLTLFLGLFLALIGLGQGVAVAAPGVLPLALWFASVLLAFGIYRWGGGLIARFLRSTRPLWDLLDFQWWHRSIWAGLEHMLGFVRVLAEVVEGSGALLWSMLVVLILLLIRGNQ